MQKIIYRVTPAGVRLIFIKEFVMAFGTGPHNTFKYKQCGLLSAKRFLIYLIVAEFWQEKYHVIMKEKKFQRVNPFLPVNNLKDTLSFYKNKLGFYDEWTWEEMDGGIRRDDMHLIFQQAPAYTRLINSSSHWFVLMWFVDNADEVYKEFKEKEIELISEIGDRPWGTREFSIRDINGYEIRVAESSD